MPEKLASAIDLIAGSGPYLSGSRISQADRHKRIMRQRVLGHGRHAVEGEVENDLLEFELYRRAQESDGL